MNHATDIAGVVSLKTHTEPSALRFLDLMVGGFAAEEIELSIKIPMDWQGQEVQALLFLNDAGQWVELPSQLEQQGRRLKLTLPPTGDAISHLAVAFVLQRSQNDPFPCEVALAAHE
ncbi:MAG: hypothetical protein NZ610_07695 [Candidatus Bipolaricaulota bacterium]|nr:hypothetical protein [Candidatus Bipolaricaulota bacterium]MCS7275262.1 hypothetical protein [Candidatus Bipolaricaulota bacterium]MDW8111615.1 hypothetical protein [Candidatus Bipolaricaulota bacterium]MDW8328529.1 hypothetical protein [Candidatus Bipolaricaulota bacterium]